MLWFSSSGVHALCAPVFIVPSLVFLCHQGILKILILFVAITFAQKKYAHTQKGARR